MPKSPTAPDHSAREALVALLVTLAALVYSVTYCVTQGGVPDNKEIEFAWGLPTWVSYGILAPWLVCVAISWWYAYFYMCDEPWDSDEMSGDMSTASVRAEDPRGN